MNPPERIQVVAPEMFDVFRERRTSGQRRRQRLALVYTAIHRLRRRLGRT